MSLLDIKNHDERDKMITEFLALKKKLRKRNEEERGALIDRRRDLEQTFEPVVSSNREITRAVVHELTPITKELQELNDKTKSPQPKIGIKRSIDSKPRRFSNFESSLSDSFLQKYLNPDSRAQMDTTFGIRFADNGTWMIGDKEIEIDDDNIVIDEEVYQGTPGLWSLVTNKAPRKYTEDDLDRYKELLYETHALYQNYDARNPYPRASGSKKWTRLLRPIWNEFQKNGAVLRDGEEEDEEGEENGNGVKMYLQKHGRCFRLEKKKNGSTTGLTVTPRPRLASISGDGLYVRVGPNIYDGRGLILGPQSPFKNIPILGWLL